MDTQKYTILHFVKQFSGANRYSIELMSQCLSKEFDYIYLFIGDELTLELDIIILEYYTIVYCPNLKIYRDSMDPFKMIIDLLSVYLKLEHIIIHDNCNISGNDNIKRSYQIIHTLHFLPLCIQNDFFNKLNLKYYDRIICVTKYAYDTISKLGIKTGSIIYNGVTERQIEKCSEVRRRYGFKNDEVLLLFVGRTEKFKGFGILNEIFKQCTSFNRRLVVVGIGFNEHQSDNNKNVIFLGDLDNKEVHNLMGACDIGVIPSLNEQCSYVALEMMSHGMAIIATEVKGMGELFIGKNIALTVPVDYKDEIPEIKIDILKEHIITLAQNKELRKSLGRNARKEWVKRYTAKRMAKETLEVYKELAARF